MTVTSVPERRAKQRCDLGIAVTVGQRKTVAAVSQSVIGVAAVEVITGEFRLIAEVLAARHAVIATAAGPAQPRNADAPATMKLLRARTDDLHCADNFMTWNNAFSQCALAG